MCSELPTTPNVVETPKLPVHNAKAHDYVVDHFESCLSWKDFDCLDANLGNALPRIGFEEPTYIQRLVLHSALPTLNSSSYVEGLQEFKEGLKRGNYYEKRDCVALPGDFILLGETSSGKTLGYLLPVLNELATSSHQLLSSTRQPPFAVIILPSTELVLQVTHVLQNMLDDFKRSAPELSLNSDTLPIVALTKYQRDEFNAYLAALKIKNYYADKSAEDRKHFEGQPDKTTLSSSQYPPIVVMTPGVLLDNYEMKDIKVLFKDTRWLIVDEADSTLQAGMDYGLTNLIVRMINLRFRSVSGTPVKAEDAVEAFKESAVIDNSWKNLRFLFACATLPRLSSSSLTYLMDKKLQSIPILSSPRKHTINPQCIQHFIDVDKDVPPLPEEYKVPLPTDGLVFSEGELQFMAKERSKAQKLHYDLVFSAKVHALVNYLQKLLDNMPQCGELRLIIFMNVQQNCKTLASLLRKLVEDVQDGDQLVEKFKGIMSPALKKSLKIVPLHSKLTFDERKFALASFVTGFQQDQSPVALASCKGTKKARKISALICTDMASRGLDFSQVDVVLQFEFAGNVVDYIHRVGRTCRLVRKDGVKGQGTTSGVAVNFITQENQILAGMLKKLGDTPLEACFSANRSLNRRTKRAAKAAELGPSMAASSNNDD